jgi:hypothetical protein
MTMMTTLTGWRDKAGHHTRRPVSRRSGGRAAVAVVVLALFVRPAPAEAQRSGSYDAPRFDVAVQVLEGGDLDVRETITFRFQSGSFRRVWREIPTSRTDGIDVLDASVDGKSVPRGEGPGRIKVSGRNRVKVEWQFDPVEPSSHTFGLHYRARGVVYRDGSHDVVRWRLLPSEHRYTIGESRSTINAPATLAATPVIETRRVGTASHQQEDGSIAILASNVERNGWVIAELRYPAGEVIAALPAWQEKRERAAALAPRWITAAAGLFGVSLVLLFAWRQGYSRPSVSVDEATTTDPPEPLPAAMAAVLAAKGGPSGYHPSATLFDLADRGVLAVREVPRAMGVRSYEVSQTSGRHDLADHEREALAIAFAGRSDEVSLSKARARLARSSSRFAAAVNRDLLARGYLDPSRKAVRDRLMVTSVVLLVGSAIGSIAMATLIPRFEGWPFLLPFALCAAGIIGIVLAVGTSPLSDQGLVQAARWRGFRRYLKSAVEAKDTGPASSFKPRWIVYGIAVGLAAQWARYLKAHPGAAPVWFQAATPGDGGAFASFIGSQAATSGGSGGGGGGAAGGGGSGAG